MSGAARRPASMSERDRRQLPAVIAFSSAASAPIAEETTLFAQCVAASAPDSPDTCSVQRRLDKTGEIKKKMVRARCRLKVTPVLGIPFDKRLWKSRAHLICPWADTWSDAGDDRRRACSQPDHRGDGRFDDAIERAAPAGVGGGYHGDSGIGHENGRAVRRQDSQRNPREAGRQRIRLDRLSGGVPIIDDAHVRAVNLMDGPQIRRLYVKNPRYPGSVLRDVVAIVGRTETAVQRCIYSVRDPTLTREKTMRNSDDVGQIFRLKCWKGVSRHAGLPVVRTEPVGNRCSG